MFCRTTVCLFVFLLLVIVLYALLRIEASNYPFDIFKLSLCLMVDGFVSVDDNATHKAIYTGTYRRLLVEGALTLLGETSVVVPLP